MRHSFSGRSIMSRCRTHVPTFHLWFPVRARTRQLRGSLFSGADRVLSCRPVRSSPVSCRWPVLMGTRFQLILHSLCVLLSSETIWPRLKLSILSGTAGSPSAPPSALADVPNRLRRQPVSVAELPTRDHGRMNRVTNPQVTLDLARRRSLRLVLDRIRTESQDQSEKGRWFEHHPKISLDMSRESSSSSWFACSNAACWCPQ